MTTTTSIASPNMATTAAKATATKSARSSERGGGGDEPAVSCGQRAAASAQPPNSAQPKPPQAAPKSDDFAERVQALDASHQQVATLRPNSSNKTSASLKPMGLLESDLLLMQQLSNAQRLVERSLRDGHDQLPLEHLRLSYQNLQHHLKRHIQLHMQLTAQPLLLLHATQAQHYSHSQNSNAPQLPLLLQQQHYADVPSGALDLSSPQSHNDDVDGQHKTDDVKHTKKTENSKIEKAAEIGAKSAAPRKTQLASRVAPLVMAAPPPPSKRRYKGEFDEPSEPQVLERQLELYAADSFHSRDSPAGTCACVLGSQFKTRSVGSVLKMLNEWKDMPAGERVAVKWNIDDLPLEIPLADIKKFEQLRLNASDGRADFGGASKRKPVGIRGTRQFLLILFCLWGHPGRDDPMQKEGYCPHCFAKIKTPNDQSTLVRVVNHFNMKHRIGANPRLSPQANASA